MKELFIVETSADRNINISETFKEQFQNFFSILRFSEKFGVSEIHHLRKIDFPKKSMLKADFPKRSIREKLISRKSRFRKSSYQNIGEKNR